MTRSPASAEERIIGRYQLVAELGDGPLGMLWAAVVTSGVEQGRVVAVRRLPEADAEARRRLKMAGDTAMQIRHPRLVALLDVVNEPRCIATVSEHVDGELLSVLLRSAAKKQAPLPPAIALRIAFDVLTALRAARDLWTKATPLTGPEPERLLRAVYGGVTPADIVVASYGDTVLSNVGVAGMAALMPELGEHPDFLAYRAPEQLDPNAIVDERADVFSIGVIVWEMLAHRPLFGSQGRYHGVRAADPAAEAKEVADRLKTAGIPRIDAMSRTGPPIPKTVVEIVARALERKPSDRFSTLEQMSEALRALSRESIATAEQVVVAIDRLAREAIDARRAALEMAVGYRAVSDSKPPPSNRTTQRPPAPQTPERIDIGPARAPALSGERNKQGFTEEEEELLDRQTLQPRVRSKPNLPKPVLPPLRPPPVPGTAGPPGPPPPRGTRVATGRRPAGTPDRDATPLLGTLDRDVTPAINTDPAANEARALFQPKLDDDFSDLPTQAGADGVPPPPPVLTRSKPPSAPPPPLPAPAKSEFEADTAASGAAISVSTTPRGGAKNRTLVVAAAGAAALLIVVVIVALSRGSSETPAQTPTAAKMEKPAQQSAKQAQQVKETPPAPAPAPTPAAVTSAAAEPAAEPAEDTAHATEQAAPAEPPAETKQSEPARRQAAPERAPARPKPKESFRPRGI
jgi:serine/threonine-protein kinase